jgi:hypothetical protein
MASNDESVSTSPGSWIPVGIAWLLVSVPLLWGVWTTLVKAAVLFR